MFSYTGLRNLFGDLTNDDSASNLTLGDTLINLMIRRVQGLWNWYFLDKTDTTETTTASTQFYKLPYRADRLLSAPTITVGTHVYTPKECPSRQFWDEINETSRSSDIPEWYFIFDNQVGFYPTPATSSNTITMPYRLLSRNLVVADYTTGTITTATNAGTTIVGSGTTWTSQMAGRFIRITRADGAATGDGEWYEISSVTNTTTLVLRKKYQGTTLAAASATYTIGEMPDLPRDFHQTPVWGALRVYFTSINPDPTRAALYRDLFNEDIVAMKEKYQRKTDSPVIEDLGRSRMNPNLYISL